MISIEALARGSSEKFMTGRHFDSRSIQLLTTDIVIFRLVTIVSRAFLAPDSSSSLIGLILLTSLSCPDTRSVLMLSFVNQDVLRIELHALLELG